MQTPMVGTWDVLVHGVKPFTIHGDVYYEVHVVKADGQANQMLGLRIPQHATKDVPQPGEKWQLTFLMGQVTAAIKI